MCHEQIMNELQLLVFYHLVSLLGVVTYGWTMSNVLERRLDSLIVLLDHWERTIVDTLRMLV
jgi:hypothetical protein